MLQVEAPKPINQCNGKQERPSPAICTVSPLNHEWKLWSIQRTRQEHLFKFNQDIWKKKRTRTQTWRQNATTNKLWVVIYHAFKRNEKNHLAEIQPSWFIGFLAEPLPMSCSWPKWLFPHVSAKGRRTSPEMTIINWAPSSGASETPKEPGFQVSTPGSDSAIGGVSLRDGSQPDLTQYFGKL